MAYRFVAENIPSDTVLYMGAAIKISAPAEHVFDVFTSTSTWPDWNRFMPSAEVTLPPDETAAVGSRLPTGTKLAVQIRMKPSSGLQTQHMTVTGAEDSQVNWSGDMMPKFLLRPHRTSEARRVDGVDGGEVCEFRSWESMGGPVAYAVKALYGSTLQTRFLEMAEDLKAYCEKTWAEGRRPHSSA